MDNLEVLILDSCSVGSSKDAALVAKVIAEKKFTWGSVTDILKWS